MDFYLGDYQAVVEQRLSAWRNSGLLQRMWDKDFRIWAQDSDDEITDRLGWLRLPVTAADKIGAYREFAGYLRLKGFTRVILLGMGGSSLAPEMLAKIFGSQEGYPELSILDSTHPRSVKTVESRIDLGKTFFLASSKSGTTLETMTLLRHFFKLVQKLTPHPGKQFAVITDPGSDLEKTAEEAEFAAVFAAPPDVGGRFSALSPFGLVPAAILGMDLDRFVAGSREAWQHHHPGAGREDRAGLILGAVLGEIGKRRDKLLIRASSRLDGFPDWLEQLIAESLGKNGRGILPVIVPPGRSNLAAGNDRMALLLSVEGDDVTGFEQEQTEWIRSGVPLIRAHLPELYALSGELFKWEIAVAAAGAALEVHPFNQPDVALSKQLTAAVLKGDDFFHGIELKPGRAQEQGMALNLQAKPYLEEFLAGGHEHDYISVLAFLPASPAMDQMLDKLVFLLSERTGLAVTRGYGPRYLHSTGQYHKGGPNRGWFIILTDTPSGQAAVSPQYPSLESVIHAQAWGDLLALQHRERRAVRFLLPEGTPSDIGKLIRLIE